MHANAALTPKARLRLGRLVVLNKVTVSDAATRFQCSYPTARRWAGRFRELHEAGVVVTQEHMGDRSSRPRRSPTRTAQPLVRRIVHVRWKRRLGPVGIAGELGVPASTVHAVLRRCGISRLRQLDRATGEPVRRYEHAAPGDLLHVDVKKLGNIPDGGGWRFVGRSQGKRNRAATPDKPRSASGDPKMGTAFVHSVLDDHSRVAYSEIHDDETALTACRVLRRAVLWFADRGVSAQAVLSDNGSCCRSTLWV